jgi:Mg/Co/Ni transporter MgtE
MKGRDARAGGDINRAVAKQIGAIAYKELIDMTSQQAIQALKRMYGSDISKTVLDTIIKRLEDLNGLSVQTWRTALAGRD